MLRSLNDPEKLVLEISLIKNSFVPEDVILQVNVNGYTCASIV